MKKIFFSIIAATAVFASCNTEIIENKGEGSLSIDISCKSDLHEVQTKATDDEIINNLSIDIAKSQKSRYNRINDNRIEQGGFRHAVYGY